MAAKAKIARETSLMDAAATLDIHPQTLRGFVRKGAPCDRRAGKVFVSLPELGHWMQNNGHTGKPGRPALAGSAELINARVLVQKLLAKKYSLEIRAIERAEKADANIFRAEAVRAIYAISTAMLADPEVPIDIRQRLESARAVVVDLIHGVWYAEPTADDATIPEKLCHARLVSMASFYRTMLESLAARSESLAGRSGLDIRSTLTAWIAESIRAWTTTHEVSTPVSQTPAVSQSTTNEGKP